MRYFKPIRLDLYSFMKQRLDNWYGDLGIYLCMESDEVWRKALGWSPADTNGLSRFLDMRALKFFPELPKMGSHAKPTNTNAGDNLSLRGAARRSNFSKTGLPRPSGSQ
jgi:hypothetical protein